MDGTDAIDTSDNTAASHLTDELQNISEIERLQQQNAEFNSIVGIDNLFIHYGRSDNQLLDEMVAEFGLECPDFDIFKYVDPALNAAHDDYAAEALNAIDVDVGQQDVNLSSVDESSNHVEESCEELVALKRRLKYQQEMILDLCGTFNALIGSGQMNPGILLEGGEQFQHKSQADECARAWFEIPPIGNAIGTNEESPVSDFSGKMREVPHIESVRGQPNRREGHDNFFVPRSDSDANKKSCRQLLYPENDVSQFNCSLRIRKVRIAWKGEGDQREFTSNLMDDETFSKAARFIRKNSKGKRLLSARKRFA